VATLVYRDVVRLLAEDLVLVLLGGNGRTAISRQRLDLALAGTALADLGSALKPVIAKNFGHIATELLRDHGKGGGDGQKERLAAGG
jgi:hypothetical protein